MLLQFVFCKLLFIPLILSDTLVSKPEHESKTVIKEVKEPQNLNDTKITMVSEGGAIVSSASTLTLPKENHTNLISLDNELGKPKERTVVARKGVQYNSDDNSSASLQSVEVKNKDEKEKLSDIKLTEVPKPKLDANTVLKEADKLNKTDKANRDVLKPLKPLVLSYEALSEAKQPVINQKLQSDQPTNKPSSKPIVDEQIPNPNAEVPTRIHITNSSHPGLIMPVIITILTVPLFAVLGYMALKRGQEAWKNRHYKRMDFLLDGMYND